MQAHSETEWHSIHSPCHPSTCLAPCFLLDFPLLLYM